MLRLLTKLGSVCPELAAEISFCTQQVRRGSFSSRASVGSAIDDLGELDEVTSKWLETSLGYEPEQKVGVQRRRVSLKAVGQVVIFSQRLSGKLVEDSSVLKRLRPYQLTFLAKVRTWGFDLFRFADDVGHHFVLEPIVAILWKAIGTEMNVAQSAINKFAQLVALRYRASSSYHNQLHAADVTQSAMTFLGNKSIAPYLTAKDHFVVLISAMIHDVDHPARTNAFLVNTHDPLAMLYNDRAVLESHHASTGLLIAQQEGANIFAELGRSLSQSLRSRIIRMVLATDLQRHFELVTALKAKIVRGSGGEVQVRPALHTDEERDAMLECVIKAADVGSAAKASSTYARWTDCIMAEFYEQGDAERRLELPISTFMDRESPALVLCQIGFIDFIVMPLFRPWCDFLQGELAAECMSCLTQNRAAWEAVKAEQTSAETASNWRFIREVGRPQWEYAQVERSASTALDKTKEE